MALPVKFRPIILFTRSSLISISPRTVTKCAHFCSEPPECRRSLKQSSSYQIFGNGSFGLKRNGQASGPAIMALVAQAESKVEHVDAAKDLSLKEKMDAIQWIETTPDVVSSPAVTGAILPFWNLNFLQQLFFPYTYAVMYYLDYMASILPWWAAIVATTATARLLFFPLVVKQNIVGIKAHNVMPETQKIQRQINEAMMSADAYGLAIAKTKLKLLYEKHGIAIKDRLLPVLVQTPLYMSLFFLLRKLTNIPSEGLTTGGILWFTDLTVPDPYYILPLITATSMFILLEFGLEGGANPSLMAPAMRYFLRAIPVGLFAIIYSFPAATLLFWSTSNLFTLSYAMIMRAPSFKRLFKIPQRRALDPSELPLTSASFSSQVKSAIDKTNARRTSMDIRRLDDIAFRKAGVGPLRKTYKEAPLKSNAGD